MSDSDLVSSVLKEVKDPHSKVFLTDYSRYVVAESRTLSDLRKKVKNDSVTQKKLKRASLEPHECIWWWSPDSQSLFTIEIEEKPHNESFVIVKKGDSTANIVGIASLLLFEALLDKDGETIKK
jgi:hypothetical protein